jgi:hypothetical protein
MRLTTAISLCIAVNVGCEARSDSRAGQRVPVSIGLVPDLPQPAISSDQAVVLRRVYEVPPDVVLIREPGDGKAIASAIFTLVAARQVQGETVSRDVMLRVPPSESPPTRADDVRRAEALAQRLRVAPAAHVPGVGRVPTVVVYLPRKTSGSMVPWGP